MPTQNERITYIDEYVDDPYLQSVVEDEDSDHAPMTFVDLGGLIVRQASTRLVEWVNDQGEIIREPEPKLVASLHFGPLGNLEADTSKRSQILYQGFRGVSRYIDDVEAGKIEKPFALRGTTDHLMAHIAQRLGFRTVHHVHLNGLDRELVVAKYDDIVEAVKLLKSGKASRGHLVDRIAERAAKEALKEPD